MPARHGRSRVAALVAGALVVTIAGAVAPASGDPMEDPVPGYANVALLRAVVHSSYATNNFNNTGHLATDGIYVDPTANPAARPAITASSAGGTGPAANAFDYTVNGATWTSTGTLSAANPQWVAIDLLAATELRSYRVQPFCNSAGNSTGLTTNYPSSWEFQGSDDGADWTVLDSRSGLTGDDRLPCRGATYPVANADFQHYRLVVTAANTRAYNANTQVWTDAAATTVRVGEIYLYGPDGYPVVPTPVFQSFWQSSTAQAQSLMVDLGAPADFDTVKLLWNSDTTAYATDYTIDVSDDAATWTEAATVSGASGWSHGVTLDPAPTGKQYVRVNFTDRVGADYRLQELEVWGTGGADYTLDPAPAAGADGTQYLTGGDWKITRAYQANVKGEELASAAGATQAASWLPATVPGTVLTSFIEAGAIVDPDFSDYQTQISDSYFTGSDWWYANTFTIPAAQEGKRTWLNFQAINWKANVYLNGHRLGTAARSIADGDYDLEGAYTPGKFDITEFANYGGSNYLAVLIKKNDYPGAVTLQTLASAGNNGGMLGADNPTVHASIGWDWLPTVRGRNIGIYEDVYLSYSQDVLIENPWAITDLDTQTKDFSHAEVTVKTELTNASNVLQYAYVTATITPSNTVVVGATTIPANSTKEVTVGTATIADPELWWPNGYGDQPLYDVALQVLAGPSSPTTLSDETAFKMGIREYGYEWLSQPELDAKDATAARNPHAGLNIYVNGTRVIGRGGNWGLSDRNMANTAEDFDLKMRLHAEANLNMVRNWVGMTGHPGFYDAADKWGIMLMDDFWLANPYDGPNAHDEKMFMASAEAKVKRVRYHASVAFYCGRNEGSPSVTLEPKLRALTASGIGTLDPTRTYVADSAHPREGMDGHGPYGVRDAVWYFDNTPAASGYNSNGNGAKNLSSERGQLNIPTAESMRRMLGDDVPWPPATATAGVNVWGLHDFTTGGATEAARELDHIRNTYDPDYVDHGFAEFVTTAQLMNYDNHRAMYEAVYVNDTPGLMQWMSQSAWPSMAWQTYDFYYDINGGYYGEKTGNQPVNAILDIRDQTVFLSNESRDDLADVTVKAEVFSLAGTKIGESAVVTSLEAGGRSSQFTLDESLAVTPALGVSNLLYKRVGPPLLEMPVIADYSGTRYVRTSVVNGAGEVLGSNFYWTNPDVTSVWPAGSRTNRGTNSPNPWLDYQAIRTSLKGTDADPVAPVTVTAEIAATPAPEPGWGGLTVKLTNTGDLPALQIHINGKDENGEQILPFIADDNYITLMPGESRSLTVKYDLAARAGLATIVGLDGFNVVAADLPITPTSLEIEALRQTISVYGGLYEPQEARYTAESYAVFAQAMSAGRAALAATYPSADDVVAATAAIRQAADGLVDGVDASPLEALVLRARGIVEDPSGWVSVFIPDLTAALDDAEALLSTPGLTQDQVTAGVVALAGALAKVAPKGDKTALTALVGVASGLDASRYTPSSWVGVAAGILAAGVVIADSEPSVDEVDEAFSVLAGALNSLVLRAAKVGLKSVIDVAEVIMAGADLYVPASLTGLPEALAAAVTVWENDDATMAEVSSAQSALLAKVAAVRVRPLSSSGTLLSVSAVRAAALAPAEAEALTVEVSAAQAPSAVEVGSAVESVPVGVKAFAKTPRPHVSGAARVGGKLKVKAGTWSPRPELSYQWYRGVKKIANATKAVYKVRPSDRGKRITVKVTAKRAGYATTVRASARTTKVM
jgi:hypothetical protein